ncbi:MAG: hypothetical protein JSW71_13405 [Gemmatimonadota bacterium]|nr:MAG: hypothetical protein JSW71_13405 [Gemmatimonadota bacterium]
MVRTIVSYSIIAVVGVVALKLVFGLLGFVFSLLSSLFWLAAIGLLIYVILRIFSPETATRVKETIRGKEKASD